MLIVFTLLGSYNMLKKRGIEGGRELNSGQTLLYAAEASQSCRVRSGPYRAVYIVF